MKVKKLYPLSDRVLVQPIEESELTEGGLLKPDIAKERPVLGRVAAVGDAVIAIPIPDADLPRHVRPGRLVLYGKFSGTDIGVDGVDYLLLRLDEILAVVECEPSTIQT